MKKILNALKDFVIMVVMAGIMMGVLFPWFDGADNLQQVIQWWISGGF